METANCKEHLTFENIAEAYQIKSAHLADEEIAELALLRSRVNGCIYECYHEPIVLKLIITYKKGFRQNRIEDAAEDAFINALEKFEKYVSEHGLYEGAQIKTIFYNFCRTSFLQKLREIVNSPTGNNLTDPDDDDTPNDKEDYLVKEIRHACLEEYMLQGSRCAKIIAMRHYEKLKAPQLAERLKITQRFSAVLVNRCMERTRAFMKTCTKNKYENQY